jgi:hypothetical protein
MIVDIALASNTAPSAWWDEDDATLATAVDILQERARAMKGGR